MEYAFPGDLADQVIARWHTFAPRAEAASSAAAVAGAAASPARDRVLREPRARGGPRSAVRAVLHARRRGVARPLRRGRAGRAVSTAASGHGRRDPVARAGRESGQRRDPRALAARSSGRGRVRDRRHPARGRAARARAQRALVSIRRRRRSRWSSRCATPASSTSIRAASSSRRFAAGRLHDQIAFSALEFLPISDILARGEAALRPRPSRRSRHEWPAARRPTFEWTALLNTILCIVNGVREHGHGGTVLLVAPGSASARCPCGQVRRGRARVACWPSDSCEFLNTRSRADRARLRRERGRETAAPTPRWRTLQTAAFAAEEDLADAADVVSRLTAVDGASCSRSDLRVPGFGAEIVLDAAAPVTAYEVAGRRRSPRARGRRWTARASACGTGRPSAAWRWPHHTAAFVVSQDGEVSFFWKQAGRVFLKRNVNTANPERDRLRDRRTGRSTRGVDCDSHATVCS